MPNLITQTPFPRTTPQLPYSRWASLVDANVATWSPTWIVQRNSYRPAPLGRIARATHSRAGDAIGPEVMSEPIPPYSRWVSINDALVAAQSPTWITARNSYRPAPRGRIARATHSRAGDVIGPEVMSEPSSVPWQKYAADNAVVFDTAVVTPTFYVADFMARAADRIDVRAVNQPETDWVWDRNDDVVAQTIIPPTYNLKYRATDPARIDTRSINEPSLAWIWDRTDDVVAQTIVPLFELQKYISPNGPKLKVIDEPSLAWIWDRTDDIVAQTIVPLFELQAKYISPERRKTFVSFVNEPDSSPWIYPNTIVAAGFDETLWPAIEQLLRFCRVDLPKIRVSSINEPALSPWVWLENDNFIASVLPGILQPLKFRSPDRRSIDTRAIVEPYSIPWIWRASDDVIATIAPNLWVPKYLARDRQRVDVREISEPELGWIIIPIAPPYVPLDPKLWPAIVQQLNAIRTRSRNELNVITINVPGFGWVTGYIPPVVIATGSHEKRKWRRSG